MILDKIKYVIGIDGGTNNGYCVFDRDDSKIIKMKTLSFWELINELDSYFFNNSKIRLDNCLFIVEDPNQIKPNFQYNKKFKRNTSIIGNISIYDKISQNIGMNKRTTQLIHEYISSKGAFLILMKPEKSKIDKDRFLVLCSSLDLFINENIDNYSITQHSIDAFMLIYRNINIKRIKNKNTGNEK